MGLLNALAPLVRNVSTGVAANLEGQEIGRQRQRKTLLEDLALQRQAEEAKAESERRTLLNELTKAQTTKALAEPNAPARRTQVVDGQLVDLDTGTAQPIQGFTPAPKTPSSGGTFTQFTDPNGAPVFFNPTTGGTVRAPQGFQPPSPRTGLPTEGERKNAGLLLTGENGYKTLASLLGQPEDDPATPQREDEVAEKSAPGFWNRQLSKVGMGIGNILSPNELRQIDQAAYDLQEAWMRLTSGGAIQPDEIRQASKALIPQPGDDAGTLAQKARSRRLRVEALRQAAGRATSPNAPGTASPQDDLDAQINAVLGRQP